jgi:hypothetical protein
MRVRLLTVPFALAIVAACVGSDPFTGPGGRPGLGGPAGDAGNPDAGDGGPDGGDGGTTTDGGCTPGIGFNTTAVDNCIVPGTATTATVVQNGCQVTIIVNDGWNCSGTLAGASNAFTGTCNTNPCQSPSIPGTIDCVFPSTSHCTAQVCPTSGICPP